MSQDNGISAERTSAEEEALNRAIKRRAWAYTLRVAPLIPFGPAISIFYLVLAAKTDQDQVLYGIPLLLAGSACAVVGFRRRLADLRATGDPTTRGTGLLFLAWAASVVGLTLPWYLAA